LKQAVRWNLIPRNPVDGAEAPRPKRPELRTLTPDEVRKLLAFVEETPRFALYALAVTTGLRRGELLGLRWDDIDLDRGRLTVRRTLQQVKGRGQIPLEPKTPRSRRTVALSALAVEALRRHERLQEEASRQAGSAWQDTGTVFATSVGTPFEGGVVSRTFQSDLSTAGLPRVRFHDLRHTCATLLLEGDTNPKVVQEMLGHSTIVLTLDVYSHVLPHMQERAATVFDRVLSEDARQPVAASPGEGRG
ncbi:MAG: site-specific integrase, partial [Dehalococcoidia bacterium]